MVKTGFIGETLEVFQEETEKGLKTAAAQITAKQGPKASNKASQAQASHQNANPTAPADSTHGIPSESTGQNQPQDASSKQFIADLYGGKAPDISTAEVEKKKLEDKQKEEALRQKLHDEYYQNLINPPKPQELRQQEKIEKEEEEKKQAIAVEEEKKKKEELPAVMLKNQGTAEKLRGVSG